MNNGKHINDRRLIYTKTSFLEVDAPEQVNRLMINLDGEYGGDAPMRFENLHNHIEFCKCRSNSWRCGRWWANYQENERRFIKEVERLSDEDINGDGKIGDETK